jgi:hypothetical protein
MPADLQRPDRLQIMLSAEEMAAVDDFRFQRRMPSRAAAVRELMKRGLAAEGFTLAAAGERSTSFGVLDKKTATSRQGGAARDEGDANTKENDGAESKQRPGGARRGRRVRHE